MAISDEARFERGRMPSEIPPDGITAASRPRHGRNRYSPALAYSTAASSSMIANQVS